MATAGQPARGLSAVEIAAAVAELQSLLGRAVVDVAAIGTAHGDDDLLFVLRARDSTNKTFLHVALGGTRARVTTTARRFGKDASAHGAAIETLQRHLREATLQHVGQPDGERRMALHFATATGDRRLVVELFGARGLWALLDPEGTVLALSRDVETEVRTLRLGDRYVAPPAASPTSAPSPAGPSRFATPVLPAIDAAFTAADRRAENTLRRDRCERAGRRALQNAQDRQRGLGAQLADTGRSALLRERADMLLAFAHTVTRGAAEMTFDDPTTGAPRTIELDPSRPVAVQAKALYEKARRLDDGRSIAERRHAEAEQAAAALTAALADLAAIDVDDPAASEQLTAVLATFTALGALPRERPSRPPRAKERAVERGENFRRFVSAEGYPILVGRDNEQNDRLTTRVAKGNDVWLHVGGGRAGSHVVVRLPKQKTASLETLLDAAALAVHFSKARGESRIEVVYTLRKHVRKPKGLPAGAVVPSQTKTIVSLLDEGRLRRLLDSAGEAESG